MIEHHALAIVHPVLELIGTCRPSSLRTATALSAVLEYPEFQVATALIYLESLGVIRRQAHTDGQVAWRLAGPSAPTLPRSFVYVGPSQDQPGSGRLAGTSSADRG